MTCNMCNDSGFVPNPNATPGRPFLECKCGILERQLSKAYSDAKKAGLLRPMGHSIVSDGPNGTTIYHADQT